MKVVLLAGGRGTRISEESHIRPKPMIEIGGFPILWHIMKVYSAFGIRDFVICLGYKGYMIKDYFSRFLLNFSDISINTRTGNIKYFNSFGEDWDITLVDTGDETMTGGRLKRIQPYLTPGEAFCMTYGDGLADIDIAALLAFHRSHGKLVTLTAVSPPGRFGVLDLAGETVERFKEKPELDGGAVSGGFFVIQPEALERIAGDSTVWEQEPLQSLASDHQLMAYAHRGFWQPLDTLRDKILLDQLWQAGNPPWKLW